MVALDQAYTETKAALLDVLAAVDSTDLQRQVPAAPDWTVLNVVAHITGIAVDSSRREIPAGLNLLEQFRDETVVQIRDSFADQTVSLRHERSLGELTVEWDVAELRLSSRLAADCPPQDRLPAGFDSIVVTDLCVHTDDILGALELPPRRHSPAGGVAMASYCFGVDYRIRALGLPALALQYGDRERILGTGEALVSLRANRWELLRVLAGRRSRAQIEALDWSGDPSPYLALLPAYGERSEPLFEALG